MVGRCEICGLEDDLLLEGHHIIPVSEGGLNNQRNVCILCPNCHTSVHRGLFTNLQRHKTTVGWRLFFDGGDPSREMPCE